MSAIAWSPGEGDRRDDSLVPSQLRDALLHLHDLTRLETHPLAKALGLDHESRRGSPSVGKALRQRLVDAIESERPAKDTPAGSHAWRSYHLLRLRYLEALDASQVQRELSISKSEYHRIHHQAILALASLLRGPMSRVGIGLLGESLPARVTDRSTEKRRGVVSLSDRAEGRRTNLPHQLTSFVGREREMAEVRRLLGMTRLLTLTGSGGCGKTRLAYQVAEGLIQETPEEHSDGLWVVELASLAEPQLVPQTAASSLGLRQEAGQDILDTLIDHLRQRHLVLVLDNCEHLLDASARLADSLLRACPTLEILATSRQPLGIAGETTYRVPSLSLPDLQKLPDLAELAEYESVRLFVERARSVQPAFALSERNARPVAEVCSHLDGIPLAIELAAALVRGLTIEGIARRLDDRFRVLSDGSRTALPRQQTLRATIDWSHDLLSSLEKTLFRRLAVFSGGWCLEAAEEICTGRGDGATIEREEILDLLLRLVDHSLVVAEVEAGQERYRLLETIRQYALEKLLESGETLQVRDLHRDWALSLIGYDPATLVDDQVKPMLDRLELEHDNLRAALSWCLETDPALGLRLAGGASQKGGVFHLWLYRGYPSEGRYWLRQLLGRAPEHTVDRARVLEACASLASDQGDLDEAKALAEEALAVARDTKDARAAFWPLVVSGDVASLLGNRERSKALLREAVSLARGLGDPLLVAYSLHWLSGWYSTEGDYRRARDCAEVAAETFRALGKKVWTAAASTGIAGIEQVEGNYAPARQILEESTKVIREVGARDALGWSLTNLGYRVGRDREYERGVSLLRESLVVLQSQGHRLRLGRCLYLLGIVEEDRGAYVRSVRLIGAAMKLIGRTHPEQSASEVLDREASLARSLGALGEEAFARAWAEGQAMTLEQAVEYALQDGDQ